MKKSVINNNRWSVLLLFVVIAIGTWMLWQYSQLHQSILKLETQRCCSSTASLNNDLFKYFERLDDERNAFFVIVGVLSTIFAAFLMWTLNGSKKEMMSEFDRKARAIAEEKAQKVIEEMAKQAEIEPEIFKEAIRAKAVEIELRKRYPIVIVYDDENVGNTVKKLLRDFSYKSVNTIEINQFTPSDAYKESVIFIVNSLGIDWNHSDNAPHPKLSGLAPETAIFYFCLDKRHEIKDFKCVGSANSYATIYSNLISTLHYKRYLDKH